MKLAHGDEKAFRVALRSKIGGSGATGPITQQWGTVRSVISGSLNMVGVTLGAQSLVVALPYNGSYSPTVGDTVSVLVDSVGVMFVNGKTI